MYDINIIDEQNFHQVSQTLQNLLIDAVARTLDIAPQAEREVNVLLCDDARIGALNGRFRGKRYPTDCLSFPDGDGSGDIAINLQQAQRQSALYRHSFEREVCFLAVHSTLHLLGYDHDPDESEMFRLQEEVLTALGLTRESS